MSAHQKVEAGKSCNMRLRSIIIEGARKQWKIYRRGGNRAGRQSGLICICHS